MQDINKVYCKGKKEEHVLIGLNIKHVNMHTKVMKTLIWDVTH